MQLVLTFKTPSANQRTPKLASSKLDWSINVGVWIQSSLSTASCQKLSGSSSDRV
jgi:hypothetical protein